MKNTRIRKATFNTLNYLSQKLYILREYHLERLQQWMDRITSKYDEENFITKSTDQ